VQTRTRYSRARRALDLAGVLAITPLAALVGLAVAVAVFIDSPGPVLYRARRVGRDGVVFHMLKFRTMRFPCWGPGLRSHEDPRQTPFGRLLCGTRLDELPQLWNVLRGQMSLVGPRPEAEEFVAAQPRAYEQILTVPPGLTGRTQLEYADEGRLLAEAPDAVRAYLEEVLPLKVYLDMNYVETATLREDGAIVLRTFVVPLRKSLQRIETVLRGRPGALREQLVLALALAASAALVVGYAIGAAPGGGL
jgi:lipopolysaccharide/colanic/teichoic acid biosynthesis glycosyltransferase